MGMFYYYYYLFQDIFCCYSFLIPEPLIVFKKFNFFLIRFVSSSGLKNNIVIILEECFIIIIYFQKFSYTKNKTIENRGRRNLFFKKEVAFIRKTL